MDYTFLPYNEQRAIKREYRIRATIVLLFFLSVAIIVGVGSLFPTYIRASREESARINDVTALKKTNEIMALESTEKDLEKSTILMSVLASSTEPEQFSTAIAAIAAIRGPVSITSFAVEQPSSSVIVVTVQGQAPTRDALLAFKDRLAGIAPGASVDLPISELARDSNIQFSVQVTESLP
jgi:hypothetical protein